jgi:hypothetical protein
MGTRGKIATGVAKGNGGRLLNGLMLVFQDILCTGENSLSAYRTDKGVCNGHGEVLDLVRGSGGD